MQMNGMKHSHSASLQSIANMQAMNMLERMRANQADVLTQKYNLAKATTPTGSGLVLEELKDWRDNLKKLLPEGTSSINCGVTGYCTINIFWKSIQPNPDSPLTPDELNFQISSQL